MSISPVGAGELIEVILYVRDMNTEVAFYRDVLGLHVKEPQGIQDFRDFYRVELNTGHCTLKLHTDEEKDFTEHAPMLVFHVTDLQLSRYKLLEQDVEMGEIYSPSADVQMCEGKDPEGNLFALVSRSDIPYNPSQVTPTPSLAPVYVSVKSRRGRSITLLRYNKHLIVVEILFVVALQISGAWLNLVPLLSQFLIIMALLWLQGNNWGHMGLRRPESWKNALWLGLTSGILLGILQRFAIEPLITTLFHTNPGLQTLTGLKGNLFTLLSVLISGWTVGSFAEEMIFRGYLLNRIADLFERDNRGWTLAWLMQAIFFGLAHIHQGPAGILSSAIYGLLIGIPYFLARRNLWPCAIAHGISSTLIYFRVFFGL
ncbi:MAG: CPBP family intramembrane metalloprotease [Ktedonobacteraceae bacterium]|nr:CPBP family intramembrane metalloprotease [Ktedonobacteraceae bacterium]